MKSSTHRFLRRRKDFLVAFVAAESGRGRELERGIRRHFNFLIKKKHRGKEGDHDDPPKTDIPGCISSILENSDRKSHTHICSIRQTTPACGKVLYITILRIG